MTPYKVREDIPEHVVRELEAYSPLVRRLLYHRGVATKAEAEIFLNPDWERDVGDPFLIHNMEKAVERIFDAMSRDETIVIYGDYDADGIPGSVVLHDLFKKIGYTNFSNYIPHRHDEGYGLNTKAVEIFANDGVNLIITVDVGITDIEPVAFAQKNGIDVIVTDHHMPIVENEKDVVPPAFAVINSKQQADTYPDDMLCGAGVAFKLAQAILKRGKEKGMFLDVPDGWEKWLLDMAGLSTIADMVPLKKENRALAYFGLKVMRKSKRVGFTTLLQKMDMLQKEITEGDLGFMIVPRINAASRMDHPLRAFELLSTNDHAEAEKLADHLSHINDQRKGHVATMIKEARKRLYERELKEVIVIGDPQWLPGLLGLAANKLMEEFARPAFVWGYDGSGVIKGSCRGTGSVSMVELMRAVPEGIFLNTGGHHDAGGFSVSHEHVHALEGVLSDLHGTMKTEVPEKIRNVDAILSLDDVHWKTFSEIEALAPFGVENEKPVFLFKDIEIAAVRLFGKQKEHLGLDFRNSGAKKISAIGFFMTHETFPDVTLSAGERVDMIATFERSTFRNTIELRLRIEEVHKVESS